jgi:hypothetical protein
MWHMSSGACLPSAAEDGQGHQTNGVNPSSNKCTVGANIGIGCPGNNNYQGSNVWYHSPAGEPFPDIPTYYATAKCGDHWVCKLRSHTHSFFTPGSIQFLTGIVQRVYYGVYFKKDVGHMSDWEWAITKWIPDGSGNFVRHAIALQVDNSVGGGLYSDST